MNTSALRVGLEQLIGDRVPYFITSADNLIDIVKYDQFPFLIIQNTDPAHKPGAHWIAWWVLSKKRCEYFDTFGKPLHYYPHVICPSTYIEWDNTRQLQNDESNYCGVWCLRFAYDKSRGLSFMQFVNQWSLNTKYNDIKLMKWIKNNTFLFKPDHVYSNNTQNNQSCNSLKYLR